MIPRFIIYCSSSIAPRLFNSDLTDVGRQSGFYLGYQDVDIAVVWPPDSSSSFFCVKPAGRPAIWWSLGVPVIMYPNLSYLELISKHGYPLVASSVEDVISLLDQLVICAEFRNLCAEVGLAISEELDVNVVAGQFAGELCEIKRKR